MKVLLSNPPWQNLRSDGGYGVRAGSRWPHAEESYSKYIPFPFFLAYTAALLEQNSIDVKLVDSIALGESVADFLVHIENYAPDLIILETSTPSIIWDLELCQTIKKKLPETRIALAGPHHDMYRPDFIAENPALDMVFLGEFELTVLELVQTLSENNKPGQVPGLILRDQMSGQIIETGRRPLIENLDDLPFPARHQLPMYRYCDSPGGLPNPSLQIIASRGCPFQCTFCSWPQIMYGGNKYRVRSPGNIADEIEYCLQRYEFKSVYFDDDTFNIGEARIIRLCDEFISRGFSIPWAIMARADTMTERMLCRMKDAGLQVVKYGVESSSQKLIDAAGKGLNLEKAEKTIRLTQTLGIKVHLTYCFGLPGETRETINQSIQHSLDMNPDSVQYSIVTPFPGSEYFERLKRDNALISLDWSDYDGSRGAVFSTPNLSADELTNALKIAYRRWTAHSLKNGFWTKSRQYLKDGVKHPWRSARYLLQLFFASRKM
ncbi:MAG: radical SAM protein [Acidobacteria bacterium]|nr:radical SAM protein [Acidobacteriota bacterium]